MRAGILVGVMALGCAWGGWAHAQGTGRSLDIQPGARQNGLGAAGVALVGDPSDAMWWNPAALGLADWHSVQWTHAKLVPGLANDVQYNYAAAAIPVGKMFGVGASGTFLSYGASEGRDNAGNFTGTFQSSEWSWAAGLGCEVLPGLATGLTVKYIHIQLAPASQSGEASTVGLDFGGLYRLVAAPLTASAGVNVQNIGPEVTFLNEDQSSPLSRNLKVGGALTLAIPIGGDGFEVGTTGVVDYNRSLVTEDFRTSNYGAELYAAYAKWARVTLRRGYYEDRTGQIEDATYGGGVRLAGISVDYAEIPQARDSGLERVKKWTFGFHTDLLLAWLAAHGSGATE